MLVLLLPPLRAVLLSLPPLPGRQQRFQAGYLLPLRRACLLQLRDLGGLGLGLGLGLIALDVVLGWR